MGRPAAREMARLLGLSDAADDDEIKRTFRIAAKRLHPDSAGPEASREQFDGLMVAHAAYVEERAGAEDPWAEDPWDEDWDVAGDVTGGSGRGTRGPSGATQGPADAIPRDSSGPDRFDPGPAPWFTPPETGPSPQPGFWSQR